MKQLFLLLFLSSLVTACGLPSSHAAIPEQKPATYRLQPGELVLAASEEDIPPIQARDEHFVPPQKADLDSKDFVVGVFIGGKSRAYPVRLLSLHEVVNDQIGETYFSVTWCPLCYSPVVYNRVVEGQVLSFQASGYLLNENLVLVDKPTDTLWSQLLGQGIRGAYRGTHLEILPSSLTTWEAWIGLYPASRVLSAEKLGYEGELPDPYSGYYASGARGLGSEEEIDLRLPGKSLVYGLSIGASTTAVPVDTFREAGLLQLTKESVRLIGVFDVDTDQGFFYLAAIDGKPLNFEIVNNGRQIRDRETGTLWNPTTGGAVKGELRGRTLDRYPSQLAYWFAWSSFYPETGILFQDLEQER